FLSWWRRPKLEQQPRKEPTVRLPMAISAAMRAKYGNAKPYRLDTDPGIKSWELPQYLPGVIPGDVKLANDEATEANVNSYYQFAASYNGLFAEGIGFMGYPALATLVQRSEYRQPSEIIAEEMTREWCTLQATGDEKADKVTDLTQQMAEYKVRDKFREATELDGVFGLSFIAPD